MIHLEVFITVVTDILMQFISLLIVLWIFGFVRFFSEIKILPIDLMSTGILQHSVSTTTDENNYKGHTGQIQADFQVTV